MENVELLSRRMKKYKIQVLMSTYNGEEYLSEQIESIFNQTISDKIHLLIRDDGSTDGTIEIIERLREKYPIDLIIGENLGINKSMRYLFENRDMHCELFALADQDDVWKANKLESAYEAWNNENEPFLYGSRSEIVDRNLNHIADSMVPKRGISYRNALIQNVIAGHTQVLNNALVEELLKCEFDNVLVIDWWIYIVACSIGKIFFDQNTTVKHRQHGNNQIGYEKNIIKLWIDRLKRIRTMNHSIVMKQMQLLVDSYSEQVGDEEIEEIEEFKKNSRYVRTRIKYVFRTKMYRTSSVETLAFKLMYLGKYYNE